MRSYGPLIGAVALCASLPAAMVLAQTATTQFNVQITITAECLINSATDLNFGNSGVLATNVDAQSQISVTCTSGTNYT